MFVSNVQVTLFKLSKAARRRGPQAHALQRKVRRLRLNRALYESIANEDFGSATFREIQLLRMTGVDKDGFYPSEGEIPLGMPSAEAAHRESAPVESGPRMPPVSEACSAHSDQLAPSIPNAAEMADATRQPIGNPAGIDPIARSPPAIDERIPSAGGGPTPLSTSQGTGSA